MLRDFTYINDIVEGVILCIDKILLPDLDWYAEDSNPSTSTAPYRIYNIGNSFPIKLMDFIQSIESACDKMAVKNYLPMQPGDVYQTNADTSALERDMGYKPAKKLSDGIKETVTWFKEYYQL